MFIRYLRVYLGEYQEKKDVPADKSQNLPHKDKDPRDKSREYVRAVDKEKPELTRILNAFETNHNPPPYDQSAIPNLVTLCHELLSSGQFVAHETEDGEIYYKIDDKTDIQLKAFLVKLFDLAGKEIIGHRGQVHSEIIDFLGLTDLAREWSANKNQEKLALLASTLVYAYLTQILLPTILDEWIKKYLAQFPDYIKNQGVLTVVIERNLVNKNTKAFTAFFKESILDYYFYQKSLAENFACVLRNVPSSYAKKLIEKDLCGLKKLREDGFKGDLWERRAQFWLKVMDYYLSTNDVDYVKIIYDFIHDKIESPGVENPTKFVLRIPKKCPEVLKNARVILRGLAAVDEGKQENEEKAPEVDQETKDEIRQWLNARDNFFIIDHFLQRRHRQGIRLSEDDVREININLNKFDRRKMQQPSATFLNQCFDRIKNEKLRDFIREYNDDLLLVGSLHATRTGGMRVHEFFEHASAAAANSGGKKASPALKGKSPDQQALPARASFSFPRLSRRGTY